MYADFIAGESINLGSKMIWLGSFLTMLVELAAGDIFGVRCERK